MKLFTAIWNIEFRAFQQYEYEYMAYENAQILTSHPISFSISFHFDIAYTENGVPSTEPLR